MSDLRKKLIAKLEENLASEVSVLCTKHGVPNIEEYRWRLGIIKGLEMAITAITEAFKGALEDDDHGQDILLN